MGEGARKHAAVLSLALFFSIFLSSEYYFDAFVVHVAGAGSVVSAQGTALGASAVGFLLFPLFQVKASSMIRRASGVAFLLVSVVAMFTMAACVSPESTLASGCIILLCLGYFGAAAHCSFAEILGSSGHLCLQVAVAYSLGIALQLAIIWLVPNGMIAMAVLSLLTATLAYGVHRIEQDPGTHNEFGGASRLLSPKRVIPLMAAVVLLAVVFSTLDAAVTLSDATSPTGLTGWPRLMLATSALAAGALFDIGRRRYMGIGMLSAALLSTLSIAVSETGGPPIMSTVVFYLSSGVFAVFFTGTFMILAYQSRIPGLWAGMGRVMNNLCAALVAPLSLRLVQESGHFLVIATSVATFVALCVAFAATGMLDLRDDGLRGRGEPDGIGMRERLDRFADRYALTPREADIVSEVVGDERTLKQISEEMGISLRMVQRHLTSIYAKTSIQSRAGLVALFFSEFWAE